MSADLALLRKVADAIHAVYRSVGSPGHFGYSTPEGTALKELYDAYNEIEQRLASASAQHTALTS